MTDQELQQFVQDLVQAYQDGYRREKERSERLLLEMESLEGRERLAQTYPEVARIFESYTLEEREQKMEELAIGTGVAHAIVVALRKIR